jgi:hypothetical protein
MNSGSLDNGDNASLPEQVAAQARVTSLDGVVRLEKAQGKKANPHLYKRSKSAQIH